MSSMRLHLVACAAMLALSSAASAQTASVEISGETYHVKACAGPVVDGYARCHAHIVTDATGRALARSGAVSTIAPSGYAPPDLWAAYYNGVAPKFGGGAPNGPVIAIVDAYGYPNAERDVGVYRAQFGLPPCTTANGCFKKLNQRGQASSYPTANVGWSQEAALDLDMASAMCPTCKIVLIEADSSKLSDLAAAVVTAASLHPIAISNSYGGSEAGSVLYASAYTQPNIAVTVSSGDSGYGAEFPATVPSVITTGGTTLTPVIYSGGSSSFIGYFETVWSGSGSGCSKYYNASPLQISKQNNATPVCGLISGKPARAEADVAAVADPATGVAVYAPVNGGSSAWLVFGGTSVSSPLIAGVYGLNGKRPGSNANDDLYNAFASKSAASYFTDVTFGKNGNCKTILCNASAGWDGPTGIGTPHGTSGF